MKWYKHFSDALDDPFIQELMDNFGHAGYVAWFGLLEIIAKENGNRLTGKLSVKPSYLKRKLRSSVKKLEKIFEFCSTKPRQNLDKTSTKPKLLFNKTLEKWDFEVCKMLEIKDNYTKDLRVTSKKPSHHKEAEAEAEAEAEEKKKNIVSNKDVKEIVDFFNQTCGTNYRNTTKSIIESVNGRLGEGYLISDFKYVIETQYKDWKDDQKMCQHITPDTLFRPSNFPKYLNKVKVQPKDDDDELTERMNDILGD